MTDETEDEDANEEYIEETNRDAIMIAAAKLVASHTVSKVNLLCQFMANFLLPGLFLGFSVRCPLKYIFKG